MRVIAIENPPVYAVGAGVRQALAGAVAQAQADAGIQAIVISGAGRLFSGAADIREFTQSPVEPHLPELLDATEAGAKPVVAALHGAAFGGGLELALSCHHRVAAPSARLGLPEFRIGLLPGAGAPSACRALCPGGRGAGRRASHRLAAGRQSRALRHRCPGPTASACRPS